MPPTDACVSFVHGMLFGQSGGGIAKLVHCLLQLGESLVLIRCFNRAQLQVQEGSEASRWVNPYSLLFFHLHPRRRTNEYGPSGWLSGEAVSRLWTEGSLQLFNLAVPGAG